MPNALRYVLRNRMLNDIKTLILSIIHVVDNWHDEESGIKALKPEEQYKTNRRYKYRPDPCKEVIPLFTACAGMLPAGALDAGSNPLRHRRISRRVSKQTRRQFKMVIQMRVNKVC